MKNIFLYSKHDFPKNLQKINSCIYHDAQKDILYRLNVMPSCTVFASEDVQKRQVMTLTLYDPIFFMINLLYKNRNVKHNDLPQCLKNKNWEMIASIQLNADGDTYIFNRNKIFDFLEKKVEMFQNYVLQKNPLDRIKLLKTQSKIITSDTITLLKIQLNPQFVAQFAKQRYNTNESRKMVPQIQQPQAIKPKPPGKGAKKHQKQPQKQKNQPSLFGFISSHKK